MSTSELSPPSLDACERALQYVSPADRDTRVRIGEALKDEFGESAFDAFDAWYAGHARYTPQESKTAWRSFGKGGGKVCHIATLIYEAKRGGFQWGMEKPQEEMTQAERAAREADKLTRRQAREAEEARAMADAEARALAIWSAADKDPANHPYAVRKGVTPEGVRRAAEWVTEWTDAGGEIHTYRHADPLLVPLWKAPGELASLQAILPGKSIGRKPAEGEADMRRDKDYLRDGRKRGCYFLFGRIKQDTPTVAIAEGWATGASIYQAMGLPVFVAFDAGNLPTVAAMVRAKLPQTRIVIAADNDQWNPSKGNPGLAAATEAAAAVGGIVVAPPFKPEDGMEGLDGKMTGPTDWNDFHQKHGDEALRAAFESNQATPDCYANWPIPSPLPNPLPPVQAFSADLMPASLRGWVMDIAHRMQCPADFPAVTAIVALSSLVGARAVIQPKARDPWQVVPNLWGMVVGRPGVKKSPAISEALKPLHRLQAEAFEAWKDQHAEWELDRKVAAMEADNNEKKAKSLVGKDRAQAKALLQPVEATEEPSVRRYVVNDATMEKLGELMQKDPWGTLAYRDELYGLLTSLDKQGQEGARAFYLQSYDGNGSYTFDRIGRGTVHIPRVCLAMIGGIQPGRLQEYVRSAVSGGSGDDGLLQRFGLAVWPDVDADFVNVDEWPDRNAKDMAWQVFERFSQLQPDSETEPKVWRFDQQAQALFFEWLVPFESEIRGDNLHPAMVAHLAKYRKLIPALALLFAMIDTPERDGLIGEPELLRALSWGDYLRTHANRVYAAAVVPETSGAEALLAKIRGGKLGTEFTPREVAQKGWTWLTTPADVRKAAEVLAQYDWLVSDTKQSADPLGRGRPSEVFIVNPRAIP